jgi:iron transport multicopper oxidase
LDACFRGTETQETHLRRSLALTAIALIVLLSLMAAQAMADVGNAGDDLRDGWYPDESSLTPQLVSGGTFGQLWSAPVNGGVYAQPLLSNGTLVVATEKDAVYGLDPATGAQQWSDPLATPWNPADIGCADIVPSIGTTSTPVIDPATNTVYLTYKTYQSGSSGPAAWYMDALDVSSGAQRPGFPVELSGTAQNDPSATFVATDQQQRPGLLLMNGVVYAAFGSHCDYSTWQGWVFGVSTSGTVTSRWVDDLPGGAGAGIWQSGVGLMSDSDGSIFFVTGNGDSPPAAGPANVLPSQFGDSVVHLQVQPNGTLEPVDYFTPFDAPLLDYWDEDFGSGGIVGLPDAYFGTDALPHLAVAVGKEGYVYLLNRDALGGYDQGPGGGDAVVQRLGPRVGVWGRSGVWPGDGGYVYITTAGGPLDVYKYGLSGSGQPSLSLAGSTADTFGWGSGPAVVTSDGATSGSALVWVIWSANRAGDGGQLRAYDPVPVNGTPQLVWSSPLGNVTNYSSPGVGAGRIYVGTRDGHVIAFGSPASAPLSGSALGFPTTTIGNTSELTLTLTASTDLTVESLSSSSSQFELGSPSQTLPAALKAGQTLSIPVTFAPSDTGTIGGAINVTLGDGTIHPFALTGTGQTATGLLTTSQSLVSLGGTTVGSELTGSVTFSNVGATPVKISGIHPPDPPFSASGLPAVGDSIAAGGSVTVTLAFDPTAAGAFNGTLEIDSGGGNGVVGVSGSAGAPGHLQITSDSFDFGSVTVGTTATKSFTITNSVGTTVTISKSKPPYGGEFAPQTRLDEGTAIAPGASLTEVVSFTPTTPGAASDAWVINSNDDTGLHQVEFTGLGAFSLAPTPPTIPQPPPGANLPPAFVLISPALVPRAPTRATIARAQFSFSDNASGVLRFTLTRIEAGRRVGGRCVRATRRDRRDARCTRHVTVATFLYSSAAGVNRVLLRDHLHIGKLAPGNYQLTATAVAPAGATAPISARFHLGAAAARHAQRQR